MPQIQTQIQAFFIGSQGLRDIGRVQQAEAILIVDPTVAASAAMVMVMPGGSQWTDGPCTPT